jgi:hypothetical protein
MIVIVRLLRRNSSTEVRRHPDTSDGNQFSAEKSGKQSGKWWQGEESNHQHADFQ